MLQKIRSGSRTWVGVILAGFLMVMFGFIGLNEFTGQGGQPTSTVIRVGNGEITGRQYENLYRDITAQESRRLGRAISYREAKERGIVRRVTEQLVRQERMAQAISDVGIMPPLSLIQQQLSQMDPQRLAQIMQQQSLSRTQLAELLRRELGRQQLLGSIANVQYVPKSVADRLFKLRNERRAATVIMVPVSAIKEIPDPSSTDLKAYYDKNKAKYKLATHRAVTALIVRPKDVDKHIKITGDRIRKVYKEQAARFTNPEQREVHQFAVKDAAVVKKVAAAIKAGQSFEDVAEKIAKVKISSLGLKNVGEFRTWPIKAMGEKVLTMKTGEVAGPFKSPFGTQVFVKLADIKKATVKPLDDVREQVVALIRSRERPKVTADLREKVDDDITAGKSLEEIAKGLKMEVLKIDSINRQGRDDKGEPYERLPGGQNFVEAVFSESVGQIGNLVDIKDGGFYVIKVEKETPAHTPKLDKIKARVATDWKRDNRERLAGELAERVAKALRDGESAEDVAKKYGLTIRKTRSLTRGQATATGDNDRFIQAKVFAAMKGEVVVGRAPNGWAVARVDDLLGPDGKAAKDARKKMSEAYRNSWASGILAAYNKVLEDRYTVVVDQPGIDAVFARR